MVKFHFFKKFWLNLVKLLIQEVLMLLHNYSRILVLLNNYFNFLNFGQTMVKLIQEILALLNNYCFFRIIVSNSNGEMCDFMLKLNS